MPYIKQDDFQLGEVSPEYAAKKVILGSNKALKKAENVSIGAGGSIEKRGGSLLLAKSADFVDALSSFSFVFNRYNSYFCLILPNSSGIATKLRIFDNIGNLITGTDINLPYAPEDVKNLNYFQANDVMFFYCSNYPVWVLKRTDTTVFSFELYPVSRFVNIINNREKIKLYKDSNNQWKAQIDNTSSIKEGFELYLKFLIEQKNKVIANLSAESEMFVGLNFALTIQAEFSATFSFQISDDGVNFTEYNSYSVLSNTTTNIIASFEKPKIFKIINTGANPITVAVSADSFYVYPSFQIDSIDTQQLNLTILSDENEGIYNFLFKIETVASFRQAIPHMKTWNTSDDTPPPFAGSVWFNRQPESASSPAVFGKSISEGMANDGQRMIFASDHTDYDTRYSFPNVIHLKNLGITLSSGSGHRSFGIYAHKTNGEMILLHGASNDQVPTGTLFYVDLNVDIENVDFIRITMDIDYVMTVYSVSAVEQIQGNIENARSTYQYCLQKEIERYGAGCIFQNRHILAQTSIIASAIGAYDNFDNRVQNVVADDAPFQIIQSTFKYGKVLHIVPFKQGLLALTTDQEIMIYGQGALTPSTVSQEIIGERGSENIKPVIMENGFLGVERGGNIYFQNYDLSTGSYGRVDISQYVKHLFKGREIARIEMLSASDNSVYILFNDATMIKLYIDFQKNILAYTRFVIDGNIKTICAIDNIDRKYLYAVVEDKLVKLESQETDNYLDFAIKIESDNINSFVVPAQLSGEIFALCYDGAGCWYEKVDETVGQTHTLQKKANKVYVGNAYISEIETLDLGGADDEFSADKSRISNVMFDLGDTYQLSINKTEIPLRFDDTGYLHKHDGKKKITVFGNSSVEKTIKIKHALPLPFKIYNINMSAR
ncbi:MAG: hypothetical protein LBQ47_05855 [Endomicrobium sp.]|jgi:hypothetical protein|nr:hypothetical protein [Endomicrobium sp.]